MLYVFIASLSLLACSFFFRVAEEAYGARLYRDARDNMNKRFVRVRDTITHVFHNGYEYTHRELCTRVLHSVMYGTLFFVRKVERVLEEGMVWLRSIRRRSIARRMEREKRRLAQKSE